MEKTKLKVEMANGRQLRATWQRTTEMYADLALEPGVSLDQLQAAIAAGRVFVDEDGDWGEKGFLYTFDRSHSEIVLARLLKLTRDSTDEPRSFVLSQETDEQSTNGTVTEPTQATELTKEQLERQDFVQSVIHAALEELADRDLGHDISLICAVRDVVLGVPSTLAS